MLRGFCDNPAVAKAEEEEAPALLVSLGIMDRLLARRFLV
jgi:hypothetical protein